MSCDVCGAVPLDGLGRRGLCARCRADLACAWRDHDEEAPWCSC